MSQRGGAGPVALAQHAANSAKVRDAASGFVALYDARTDADYSHNYPVSRQVALAMSEAANDVLSVIASRKCIDEVHSWCSLVMLLQK